MIGNLGSALRFVQAATQERRESFPRLERAGDKTMSARGLSMNGVSRKIGVPLRAEGGGKL
jgi:hypothetical protein